MQAVTITITVTKMEPFFIFLFIYVLSIVLATGIVISCSLIFNEILNIFAFATASSLYSLPS